MNAEAMIRSLATSVTTFVDQTKDNILGVQAEIQDLRATVDTLAAEVREDREAQNCSGQKAQTTGLTDCTCTSTGRTDDRALTRSGPPAEGPVMRSPPRCVA